MLKHPPAHAVLIALLLGVPLGQGSLVRGVMLSLAPHHSVCCLQQHFCPLRPENHPQPRSAHCPLSHDRPGATLNCQLRSCTHQQTATNPTDPLLRFLLPAITLLGFSEPESTVHTHSVFALESIPFPPPDPPPRLRGFVSSC